MTDEINLFLNKFENSIKNIEDEIKKNQKTNEEILTTIEDCQKEIQDSISTPQWNFISKRGKKIQIKK